MWRERISQVSVLALFLERRDIKETLRSPHIHIFLGLATARIEGSPKVISGHLTKGVVRSFALAQTNAHRPLQRSVGAFVSKQ
jgi:hypothetical protein